MVNIITINNISVDILKTIFLYIDYNILFVYGLVCKYWKDIISLLFKKSFLQYKHLLLDIIYNKYNSLFYFVIGKNDSDGRKFKIKNKISRDCYIYSLSEAAASVGNIEILNWLYNNKIKSKTRALNIAAVNGHLETMKFLKSKGCSFDLYTIEYSIKSQNIKVVKWLIDNKCPYHIKSIIYEAAITKNIDIIEFLLNDEKYCLCDNVWHIMNYCDLNIIKLIYYKNLYSNRNFHCKKHIYLDDINNRIFSFFINRGDIEILEWAKELKPSLKNINIDSCFQYNKVNVKNWLIENGFI